MPDAPTTFHGEPADEPGPGWTRAASLHRRGDDGVFNAFRAIRQGTLAELVAHVMALPADERSGYAIVKEGDHRLAPAEIAALAARPDYPGGHR